MSSLILIPLLQAVLGLLLSVQANPALSTAQRDAAIQLAQRAMQLVSTVVASSQSVANTVTFVNANAQTTTTTAPASCTTPWGNLTVASGQAVIDQPYFNNGQCVVGGLAHTYSDALHGPRHVCQNGVWQAPAGRCDDGGQACTGSWNDCGKVVYAP